MNLTPSQRARIALLAQTRRDSAGRALAAALLDFVIRPGITPQSHPTVFDKAREALRDAEAAGITTRKG
jgi:hypothetical protein